MTQSATKLKPLEKIFDADARTGGTAVVNRPIQLNEFHKLISQIELHPSVPHEIRDQFDTAKNCLLYGWFYYYLGMLAAKHSAATVELALRNHFGNLDAANSSLGELLNSAHDAGRINLATIKPAMNATEFIEYIKELRNELAHGSHRLIETSKVLDYMQSCAAIISQLFASQGTE